MHLLAESKHYLVYKDYEDVTLKVKETGREIRIGDFYGEADLAVISQDEKFCVMSGCGVIIYFLKEPFREYEYYVTTSQWKEWGRECPKEVIWVDSIKCINDNTIEVIEENGNVYLLDVYKL